MRDCGHQPEHQIVGLISGGGIVYLTVARAGQSNWRQTWDNRSILTSELALLFRGIDVAPSEIVVFGSAGLCLSIANKILPLIGGLFPKALLGGLGGRGRQAGKPCSRISNGVIETWPSRSAAAAGTGLSLWTILRKIRRGEWFDGAISDSKSCQ